ncbi:MAG: hypothetical protein QN229_03335 [Desulfurococcaceae archaeon TW002]
MRFLRGQGSLIVSVIVTSLFVLIVLPTAMYLVIRAPSSSMEFLPKMYSEFTELVSYATKEINATVFVDENNVVTIAVVNYGMTEINIVTLFFRLAHDNGTTTVLMEDVSIKVSPNSLTTYQYYGVVDYCSINCNVMNIMLLTDKGTVITPRIYTAMFLEKFMVSQEVALVKMHTYLPLPYYDSSSVRVSLEGSGFRITDSRLLEVPRERAEVRGVRGIGTGAYYLRQEYLDVTSISLSNAPVGNLYLGYNPKDTKKYDIMFSWNRGNYLDVTLVISGQNINLGSVCPYGYRVKILGFKNSTNFIIAFSSGLRITSPDPDPAKYSYLTSRQGVRISLVGSAEIVRIYCRSSNISYESSYEPYIMLTKFSADAPGPSLLMVFEDVYPGFTSTANDAYATGLGGRVMQDFSTQPLLLVYNSSTISITNSKYLGVLLVVNYRFHDNAGDDGDPNKVIFEVGLIDSEGNVLASRTFTFKELTRYEDTYPPRAQAQSATVFIPLPRPEVSGRVKTYYPFIRIQDPYGESSTLGDLDFLLLIEGLGVLLIS